MRKEEIQKIVSIPENRASVPNGVRPARMRILTGHINGDTVIPLISVLRGRFVDVRRRTTTDIRHRTSTDGDVNDVTFKELSASVLSQV